MNAEPKVALQTMKVYFLVFLAGLRLHGVGHQPGDLAGLGLHGPGEGLRRGVDPPGESPLRVHAAHPEPLERQRGGADEQRRTGETQNQDSLHCQV